MSTNFFASKSAPTFGARCLASWLLASLGALTALGAAAQNSAANTSAPPTLTAPVTMAPSAAASTTTVPSSALTYRSPFDRYKPYGSPPPTTWRAANDTVGRIGGWRTYLREGSETPVSPVPVPEPAPPKPNPPPTHHQHHQQGTQR